MIPRTSNPTEQCPSSSKVKLRSSMSTDIRRFTQKVVYIAPNRCNDEKLQHHIASAHPLSLIFRKRFSCSSCNSPFPSYYQLLYHKRNNCQHSAPLAYDDVDLAIYGDSAANHSELGTIKQLLQDSWLNCIERMCITSS